MQHEDVMDSTATMYYVHKPMLVQELKAIVSYSATSQCLKVISTHFKLTLLIVPWHSPLVYDTTRISTFHLAIVSKVSAHYSRFS